MNKKNRIFIIVSIVIVIYAIIIFAIFGKNNNQNEVDNNQIINNMTTSNYIVIDNYANFKYENKKYVRVGNYYVENSNKLFKVYSDNHYLGLNKLKYGTVWNIFNKDDEYINYDGKLFAFTEDLDIKLKTFNKRNLNDQDKELITREFKVDNFDYLVTNDVYEVDLDSNGEIDKLYCISNIDVSQLGINRYYNLVFVNMNNEIITLIKEFKASAQMNLYFVGSIFENDRNYADIAIVKIKDVETDRSSYVTNIYRYKNGKYIID